MTHNMHRVEFEFKQARLQSGTLDAGMVKIQNNSLFQKIVSPPHTSRVPTSDTPLIHTYSQKGDGKDVVRSAHIR